MKLDREIYKNLLLNKDYNASHMYRIENIPDTLYKYYSLSESDVITELDSKKIEAILNDKIWLSRFSLLNDPFEYKYMYLDKKRLIEMDRNIKFIERAFESIKNEFLVTSFTQKLIDNMPMWAHYSNNHCGFCVEYEVNKKEFFFPVLYVRKRCAIAEELIDFVDIATKLKEGKITIDNPKYEECSDFLIHNCLFKHESWNYEDEFRLLYYNNKKSRGNLFDAEYFGLKSKCIYIGKNCNSVKRDKLFSVAEGKNISIFDMEIEEESNDFKLKAVNNKIRRITQQFPT